MMSRGFKTIGIAACFLSLFCLLGGHWFALQSVAWARMLAAFSGTDSIREAVKTNNLHRSKQRERRLSSSLPSVEIPAEFNAKPPGGRVERQRK